MSMATHDKEYRLYKNSTEKSLNKQQQLQQAQQTLGSRESDFWSCHIIILKMSSFQQKTHTACEQTRKYGPCTHKKET